MFFREELTHFYLLIVLIYDTSIGFIMAINDSVYTSAVLISVNQTIFLKYFCIRLSELNCGITLTKGKNGILDGNENKLRLGKETYIGHLTSPLKLNKIDTLTKLNNPVSHIFFLIILKSKLAVLSCSSKIVVWLEFISQSDRRIITVRMN